MNRRSFLKQGALLAAAAAAVPLPLAAARQPQVKIGYLPITDATPLLVAHANGHFREEGLDVAPPLKIRSWSALVESFLTDKINVCHMLLPIPVWMRFNRGVDVKVLAWDHTNGSALTIGGSAGIRDFADLGGRLIAVPHWYSMHNVILQLGLREAGLSPVIQPRAQPPSDRQTNLVILPPPEMPSALAAGKIDGYIVAEPYNALSEEKIGAKILRFTGDIWQNHPCCVIVMRERLIREHPLFTQKVISAIVGAQLWTQRHPVETAGLLGRDGRGYLPVDREVLLRVFTGYEPERYGPGAVPQAIRHPDWQVSRIGFQPYPFPSATRFIIREMAATVMEGDASFLRALDPETGARELTDDSFAKKAITDLGGLDAFRVTGLDGPWSRSEVISLQ
ncbi:MAG: ABC transporter substrate-binding protein [Thermodesulfobacteriota bacterium]